jgi:hypothetical protein
MQNVCHQLEVATCIKSPRKHSTLTFSCSDHVFRSYSLMSLVVIATFD